MCELVDPLDRSQPTVSRHHLEVLSDAGLIVGEKRGTLGLVPGVPERLAPFSGVMA